MVGVKLLSVIYKIMAVTKGLIIIVNIITFITESLLLNSAKTCFCSQVFLWLLNFTYQNNVLESLYVNWCNFVEWILVKKKLFLFGILSSMQNPPWMFTLFRYKSFNTYFTEGSELIFSKRMFLMEVKRNSEFFTVMILSWFFYQFWFFH